MTAKQKICEIIIKKNNKSSTTRVEQRGEPEGAGWDEGGTNCKYT